MRVLTQQIGEVIVTKNDDGTASDVTAFAVNGLQVKLDISAPQSTDIFRQEVLKTIRRKHKNPRIIKFMMKIK